MLHINKSDVWALLKLIKVEFLIGILFFLGFLTINMPLVGSSEYQPILLLVLSVALLFFGKDLSWQIVIITGVLFINLLLITLFHEIVGTLVLMDFIRMLIGPVFMLAGFLLLKRVPISTFKFLIVFHGFFLVFGLLFPEVAQAVLERIGLRGANYYGGWNSYFSSEPSYFAMNFSGLIACLYIKSLQLNQKISLVWLIIGVILLFSTASVTGMVSAMVLMVVVLKSFKHGIKLLFYGIAFMMVIGISVGENASVHRLHSIYQAVSSEAQGGLPWLLFEINEVEPSGMWRPLVNVAGINMLTVAPLGFGDLNLSEKMNIILTDYPFLADLIISNDTFELMATFAAQSILSLYVLYGGLLLGMMICCILVVALINVKLCHKNEGMVELRFFVVYYLILGFVWQSALTNPFWWIILGACISLELITKKFPEHDVNRLTNKLINY